MRLEEIDGTEIHDGMRLGHTWFEVGVLRTFLSSFFYTHTFVEIGIHEGGLTNILMPNFVTYVGVELNCSIIRPQVRHMFEISPATILLCDDCFGSAVWNCVNALEKKIIYCDGGRKAQELKHFAKMCNPGDMLLAHDFCGSAGEEMYTVTSALPEVSLSDIQFLEDDKSFWRLSEETFYHARIVGWEKI